MIKRLVYSFVFVSGFFWEFGAGGQDAGGLPSLFDPGWVEAFFGDTLEKQQMYPEAAEQYRKAVAAGNVLAANSLGAMYAKGQGLPEDFAEAARLFRMAADRGYGIAQHNLGVCYADGRGVPENYVEAYKSLNLAAAQGVEDARQQKDIIAKKMTREQIAEAQKLSAEWKPKQ